MCVCQGLGQHVILVDSSVCVFVCQGLGQHVILVDSSVCVCVCQGLGQHMILSSVWMRTEEACFRLSMSGVHLQCSLAHGVLTGVDLTMRQSTELKKDKELSPEGQLVELAVRRHVFRWVKGKDWVVVIVVYICKFVRNQRIIEASVCVA